MTALFDTVLVANRGEIACRVIRTLKARGIRSVAVYSEADAGARHVREADIALCIGPAAASESYLNIAAVVAACKESGAQAVHPGYGFLSENLAFAQALADAGITFIGPGLEALNVMGDKIRSKNHVAAAGVPVVPGISEPGLSDADLIKAAERIGYPLLIKPSAGGGGKGMHAVWEPAALADTIATARRVAASAFGDDTLFLERLVATPRHIEVQILGDSFGNVIHLGERECSLQRRHQKVIEEAPSPLLEGLKDNGATRDRIGRAACAAAASVNYTGAGTVEFIVSDDAPQEFFFMEMNTRLQVEHPVTEMVTGIDLVDWQLRIAAGEELTLKQSDIELRGHAVEARVYAENPAQGFLPSTGVVVALDESLAADIRIDSSLLLGGEVSPHYDPMLAKVIAWAPERATALRRLDAALQDYVVLGPDTNIEYLRLLLNDTDVQAGHLDTNLIERKLPAMEFRHPGEKEYALAALFARVEAASVELAASTSIPWNRRDGWRLGESAPWRVVFAAPGRSDTVTVTGTQGSGVVRVNGGEARLASLHLNGATAELDWAGERSRYVLARDRDAILLGQDGWSVRLPLLDREQVIARMLEGVEREGAAADPAVRSPMPGTVTVVHVSHGEMVEAGQPLLAVEAMKMEHQLTAALSGTVHLATTMGSVVKAGQIVATIAPAISHIDSKGE